MTNEIKEMKFQLALELFKNGHFGIEPNPKRENDIRICGGIDMCDNCLSVKICEDIDMRITHKEYRRGTLEPDELEEFYQKYPEARLIS